jgi:hypothetical protein
VPTWAYDDCNGGGNAAASLVQRWVSFAESNCGPGQMKAVNDCASVCTPVQYFDANWIYPNGGTIPIGSAASENWYLHDPGYTDSAHRISTTNYGGGLLINQANTAVDSWFQNYARTNYNKFPGLMMDDASPTLGMQLYYANSPSVSSTTEITSNTALQNSHNQLAGYMTHSNGTPFLQVDNALSPNPWIATPFSMINDNQGVEGFVVEGAPWSGGITSYYSNLLDQIAYIDSTQNDFITMLSYDTTGSSQSRLVQEATELLGYSGNHLVDWNDLEKNSGNLAVYPEEGIVPTNPVQTMAAPGGSGCLAGNGATCSTGGHNNIQVASGIYRREFANCYNQGTAIGPCATIINTTGAAVTVQSSWLTQTYHHEITFNGGDVQSGGTLNLTGAGFTAGTTTIPASNAILIAS